jgi:pimeloyl-ACP methyl ester carboxylesterase
MTAVVPFKIDIAEDALKDLRHRLKNTRWPEAETPDDWTQGVPLDYLKDVCRYWLESYDWRKTERRLNKLPQFTLNIDELNIHFVHVRSTHENARPLLMTYGWPGSIVEFLKVIEPLTQPELHGGSADDAFHLVCPCLPGFGFSDKPATTGWGVGKIAKAWNSIMLHLGYDAYYAQGGDWGSAVTTAIGMQNLGQCKGIHVNMPSSRPTPEALAHPDKKDEEALIRGKYYNDWDSGYSKQQATRPQTLGYALVDSPIGQAAWILEKYQSWTDCDGHLENVLTRTELLDNIMVYWLTASGASSGRLYWESFGTAFSSDADSFVKLPTGCSIFPKEIVPTPRTWAEQRYKNIVYWNELDKGGHFAAFEQPQLFVQEMRKCFSHMPL